MAQSYTRQSTFADGDTITAALFNNEYNQLVNAFTYSSSSASSTGHRHDGTAGHGGNIHTIGDLDFLNKIVADSTNNRWGVFVQVSSSAVEQIRIQDGAIVPVTDNDIDLGTSSVEFKDAYFDGTVTTDALVADTADINGGTVDGATIGANSASTGAFTTVTTTGNVDVGGNLTVTGTTTFNGGTLTLGDSAADNVVFGADVDSHIIPDDDNTYDLGSSTQEWRNLYIDGTANIDSLVADTADINGGTVDGAIIGGSSAAAITGTAITGTSFVIGSADISEAELETIDGVTAGTVAASKAVVVDSNKDIASFRNITLTGELDAGSLDVSGDVDIDGTTNLDVVDIDGAVDMATTLAVAGNVDFNGDLDVDGTTNLDVVDIDGAVDMATTLTVGGEITAASLDISGDVDIDGTLETDALSLNGTAVTASAADINLIDGITNGTVIASKAIITDSNKDITGGRNITISGELDAATLDISGDADIDGTLEADAITIAGVTLAETISDTVGAMVGRNTETNITVTYEDSDNTLDFVIGTLNQDTTGTATLATNITVSANNSTDETVYPIFVDGATGSQGAESDTGLNYNPSTGMLTTTGVTSTFTGNITGNVTGNTSGTAATVTGAAQSNITSLGTLTTLTVDNVIINGTTIGHTSDTDLITLADGNVTIAGELDLTTLDVSGNADIDGTLEADAYTVNGTNLDEYIEDTVGAMLSSNTETGIAVTYQDGDSTIDFALDAAQTSITSLLATDIKIGEDDQTKIDFETADEIHFYAANAEQVYVADGIFGPQTDSDVDLGSTSVRWKDAYIDSVTTTGNASVGGNLTLTGNLVVNGTTTTVNSTTVTIDDPIFTLGGDSAPGSDDNKDRGIEFRWHNGSAAKLGFFGYDDSASAFTFVPDASNSSEVFSGTVGNAIFGNITGTLQTAAQANITSLGTLTALTGGTGDFNWDSNTLVVDSSANRVGILNASPDVTLDIGSATDAVHMPTGNTSQRPGSPAAGYFRYNSETAKFEGYTDEWGSIAGGGSGTNMDTNIYAGDGSDTTFTLSTAPDTEQNLMVFIDGVFQAHDSYSVSGTTLTFSTAPANGRVITAYHSTTTVGGSNNTINTMTGDGSDTTLTLSVAPVHENNVQVYFDGVYQSKANYSISGTTLTFSTAPPDDVLVEAITNTNTSSTTANKLLDADGDTQIQVEESSDEDKIRFDTGGTERMIIDSTGVGIGTSSPSTNLHIYSTADNAPHLLLENFQNADTDDAAVIELYLNDQTTGGIGDDTDVGVIRFTGDEKDGGTKETYAEIRGVAHDPGSGSGNKGNLSFFVQSAGALNETLTLDEKNVGIGIASPDTMLHVHKATAGSVTANSNTQLTIENNDHAGLQFLSPNDANSIIYFGDVDDNDIGYINYAHASNSMNFQTNTSVAMTINSAGKLGIGETSPDGMVHIKKDAGTHHLIIEESGNTDSRSWAISGAKGDLGYGKLGIYPGSSQGGTPGNTPAMTFLPAGRVGIGSTSPGQRLLVSDDANDNTVLKVQNSGNSTPYGQIIEFSGAAPDDNTRYFLRCGDTGANRMHIYSDGDVNTSDAGTLTSDRSLKTDIADATSKLADINQLQVRNFKWITDYHPNKQNKHIGFIADEFETVFPSLVVEHENPIVGQDGTVKSVRYGALIPILVKALQEADDKIDALEARITALES